VQETGLIAVVGSFGEVQADAYFDSLEQRLSGLADNPQLGLNVSSLREGYRRFVHMRHSIYYRQTRTGIRVVRILGPGMSPERNLP
jgi:plasmid stabilization system protein ParE